MSDERLRKITKNIVLRNGEKIAYLDFKNLKNLMSEITILMYQIKYRTCHSLGLDHNELPF